MIHCAITRVVREGKEADFEAAVKRFVAKSLDYHGTTGAHLLRPADPSGPREYGILRSFQSEEHMREFYDSQLFSEWQDEVAELVEGEPVQRRLHGLEAFFRGIGGNAPPKWKMAAVTWLGVYPVVQIWSWTLPPWLTSLPPIAVTGVVTGVSVITLTWFVMPALTHRLAGWLR